MAVSLTPSTAVHSAASAERRERMPVRCVTASWPRARRAVLSRPAMAARRQPATMKSLVGEPGGGGASSTSLERWSCMRLTV